MSSVTMSRMTNPEISGTSEHSEGTIAQMIERQTAKLPSDVFLWTALGAVGVSLGMAILGRKHAANFVGQWVPTLLILGVYNKLVKVGGHDRTS